MKSPLEVLLKKSFNINDKQAKILRYLLLKGISSIGELMVQSDEDLDTVKECLDSLEKLNLVKALPGASQRYKALPPYQGFLEELEKVESLFNRINEDINQFSDKLTDQIQTNLDKQIEEMKNSLLAKKEVIDDLTSSIEEKGKASQSEFKKIEKDSKDLNNRLINMFSEYLSAFESRVNKMKQSFQDEFTEHINEMRKIKQNKNETLNEQTTSLVKPQKENIRNQFEILRTNLRNSFKMFQDQSIELKDKLFQALTDSAEDLEHLTEGLKHNTIGLLDEHNKTLISILDTIEDQLNKSYPALFKSYKEASSNLRTNQRSVLSEFLEGVELSIKSIREREQRLIRSLIKLIQQKSSSRVESVKNVMQIQKSAVNEVKEDLEIEFNEFLDNNLSIYSTLMNDLQENLKSRIEEFNSFSSNFVNKMNDKIALAFSDYNKVDEKYRSDLMSLINSNLKAGYEEIQDVFSKYLLNTAEDFKESLLLVKEDYANLKSQVTNSLTTNTNEFEKLNLELKEEVQQIIDSQIGNISQEEENFETQFRDRVMKEMKRLNTSMEEVKNDTITYVSDTIETVSNDLSDFKEQLNNSFADRLEMVDNSLKEHNENTNLIIKEFTNFFHQFLERMQKKFVESSTKQHSLLKDLLGTSQNQLSSSITSFKNTINEKVIKFRDGFKISINKKLKSLKDFEKFETKIADEFTRHLSTLKESSSLIKDNLTYSLDKQVTGFGLLSESLKRTFSESIAKGTSSTEQFLNKIISNMDTTISEHVNSSRLQLENLNSDVSSVIDTSLEKTQARNETLNSEFTDALSDTLTTWQHKIKEMQEGLGVLSEFLEKLNKSTKTSRSDLLVTFSEKMDLIIEAFQEIEEDFRKQHTRFLRAFEGSIGGIDKGKDEVYSTIRSQLKDAILNNEKQVDSIFEQTLTKIQDKQSKIRRTMGNKFKTKLRAFNKGSEQRKDQLKTQFADSKINTIDSTIEMTKETLESIIQSNMNSYEKKLEPVEKKLTNFLPQFLEDYDSFISNFRKFLFGLSDELLDEFENISRNVNDTLDLELSNLFKDAKIDSSELSDEIESQLFNHSESLKSFIQTLDYEIKKNSERLTSRYGKIVDELLDQFEHNLGKMGSTTGSAIETIFKKLQDDFQAIDVEVGGIKEILKETWNEIDKLAETGMDKTWTITSGTHILAYMSEMIRRTKQSITLVIPELSKMPKYMLKDLPSHVRFHIFSDFDLLESESLLKDLLKAPNVRIWQLTNFKLYYGALRDSEEMLVAPDAIESDEIVGFVSEQEGNIKLFRNILGPSFYSDSSEIKLNQIKNSSDTELVVVS